MVNENVMFGERCEYCDKITEVYVVNGEKVCEDCHWKLKPKEKKRNHFVCGDKGLVVEDGEVVDVLPVMPYYVSYNA